MCSANGRVKKKLIIAIIQPMENAIISTNPTINIMGFQIFRRVVKIVEIAFTIVETSRPRSEIPFLMAFRGALPSLPDSPVLFFLKRTRLLAL